MILASALEPPLLFQRSERIMKSGEIYILEDDVAVRETLQIVLAKAGYRAVSFADGNALMARAREKYPVCILLDLKLPGKSGLEVLGELQDENYPAPIIMISGYGSIEIAVQALTSGASDFIEKPFRADEVIDRIERAIEKTGGSRNQARAGPDIDPGILAGWQVLSRREYQILRELLEGGSSKDIAARLNLSPRTVEDHRANILRKAHVKSTTQLMLNILRPALEAT